MDKKISWYFITDIDSLNHYYESFNSLNNNNNNNIREYSEN
jgi:hypothetical protein